MIPFAGNPLNRASEKRTDQNWIESKWRDPTSLVLPLWRLEPFLTGPEGADEPAQLGLVQPAVADSLAGKDATWIFLGLDGERALFALDVCAAEDPSKAGPLAERGYF